jgi:hypothetical protein
MMIYKIPKHKFPINISLLRDTSKILTLVEATQYRSTRANSYSAQNGKPGFKVILPTHKQGFLFADIIAALAQRIVDNKINLSEIKLEDSFHELVKDLILQNDAHVYPYMYTYETYYLAVADWWIKFSDINPKNLH